MSTKINQRTFLQGIANKFNIKSPSDWGKLSKHDLVTNGGRELLTKYGNIASILKRNFPEIKWDKSWFQKKPTKYYWNHSNQRKLFDEIWKKLKIQNPSDWGKITKAKIEQLGGRSVLEYHGKSLESALTHLYPEVEWKKEWFTKNDWKEISTHREFFDKIAKRLGINHPSDWGKFTAEQIREFGELPNSYLIALRNAYPEVEWNLEWFSKLPKGYWLERSNVRNFLSKLAEKHEIKEPNDWGKINNKTLIREGGGSALTAHGNSLLKLLQFGYPDIQWKLEWFSKYPHRYWLDKENQRAFLVKVAQELQIKNPQDWRRLTTIQIEERGGYSLLKKYGNSVYLIVKNVFSELEWKPEWFGYRIHNKEGYWKSLSNQREFLNTLSQHYNLHSPTQWQQLTKALIRRKGGMGLLLQYNKSLSQALQTIYPNEMRYQFERTDPSSRTHKQITFLTKQWTLK